MHHDNMYITHHYYSNGIITIRSLTVLYACVISCSYCLANISTGKFNENLKMVHM